MSKKSILIVEDEAVLREAYQMILDVKGFDVTAAANGKLGLDKINECDFDLILLDFLMPEMDGLEVLKKAELRKKSPDTKVVLFSNVSELTQIEEAHKYGINRHVLKASLTPDQLVSMIEELVSEPAGSSPHHG